MKKKPFFCFLALIILTISVCAITSGTVSRISIQNASVLYGNPAIDGSTVVWQDNRYGNYAIYAYDTITGSESRVSQNDASNQIYPDIWKDTVVYQDDRESFTYDIYRYNITTGVSTRITNEPMTDQMNPAVYGEHIVWSDNRDDGANYQIYINGTSPNTEHALSPAPGFNQVHPRIYGNLVVWEDYRNSNADIYLYDLSSGRETQVTSDTNSQTYPTVYGNRIAWTDDRNIWNEIFINGTSPGREYSITPNLPGRTSDHISPSMYGPKIVWVQDGSGIFMNDTSVSPALPLSIDNITGSSPSAPKLTRDTMYGDRVVWEEDQYSREIFMFTEGGPGTCPAADFTHNYHGGSAPVSVSFTGTSSPGLTHWYWDFGDGTTATGQNTAHVFLANASFDVTLTVNSPYCRDSKTVAGSVVVGRPASSFIALPITAVVPARVIFNDTSAGFPISWLWDFGDGTPFSSDQNTSHTYLTAGTYTVNLTVANAHGSSSRTEMITVLNGASQVANTSIPSLIPDRCSGRQFVTVDPTILPSSLTPNSSVMEIRPPADRGFAGITLYSLDGTGFSSRNGSFVGNITGVKMHTVDMFLPGSREFVNYSVSMSSYPCYATLTTASWQGATPGDQDKFEKIAEGSNYAYYHGTEFTTHITPSGFPGDMTTGFFLGASPGWVIPNNPDLIRLERINNAGTGGEVLFTSHLYHDPVKNLEIFEATSPNGLSTFGLSALSGTGNIFQMVTFELTSLINQENLGPGENSPSAGKTGITPTPNITASVAPTKTPVPPDPGKTAKLYTNPDGVITQKTTLLSTDRRANITIREGTLAKNASGMPLSSITIRAISGENIPGLPALPGFSFAGMAYEIQPDGATFSPALSLALTLPTDIPLGQETVVKTLHRPTEGWLDLPFERDTATGALTAGVSHLCYFALFTKAIGKPVSEPVMNPVMSPTPEPQQPVLPPTPLTTISGMLFWVGGVAIKNIFITAGAILIIAGLLYYRKRGEKERLRYLL